MSFVFDTDGLTFDRSWFGGNCLCLCLDSCLDGPWGVNGFSGAPLGAPLVVVFVVCGVLVWTYVDFV